MKTELYVTTGCYISTEEYKLVVEHPESMKVEEVIDKVSEQAYEEAMEACWGWEGMYGFGLDEEDLEEVPEEEHDEARREYMDEHVEYTVETWDEKYAAGCTYATGLDVRHEKIS